MSLLKSAVTVGGCTLASRILGFVRDQLIAFMLGTGFVAEAFFVAQRFPNFFRALFAEGALTNAFVPQFSNKAQSEGQEKAFAFARDVLSVLANWMVLFCAAAMLFMPWLMALLAPGFRKDEATFDLAVELTRICFPYLGLISLAALFSGILNSMGRFTAAASMPILLNIVMICVTLLAWHLGLGDAPDTARLLAYSVTFSGIMQLLLLLWSVRQVGANVRPGLPKLTPDVKRLIVLSVPSIISGGIMQINLMVATMLASGFSGAVAYLYYAARLYELPLGVVGVAISVVLLPALSRKLQARDVQGMLDSQNRALEFALFLTLPAVAALIVIARPILHIVFEHGAFTRADTLNVAPMLAALATGLPAVTITKILQPAFYAHEDAKTPMYFALVAATANILMSLLFSRYLGYVGIALAISVASWLNALMLILASLRRGYYSADRRFKSRLPRILFSVAVMAAVLSALLEFVLRENYAPGAGFTDEIWGLFVLMAIGSLSYFATASLTGGFRFAEIAKALRR